MSRIFMIGFMGAGKTSAGRKLAERLNFGFIDMDHWIEEREGISIQEIFKRNGEVWFREQEREVLRELAGREDSLVISTGGGVPCFHDNMAFIKSNGISVYLKLSPLALLHRLRKSKKPERPLLSGKSDSEIIEYIQLKLQEREVFYEMSDIIFPAENFKTKDLVAVIAAYCIRRS